MDPLSVIASSVAIAHVVHVTLRNVHASYRAGPELTSLHNEVSDLRLVLQELEVVLDRRQQAASPLPPNARLLQTANDVKTRLGRLEDEISNWRLEQPSGDAGTEQKRFRLLRIGRKAAKLKEEVRELKVSLSAQLSVLTATSSSRIEINVQEVLQIVRGEAGRAGQEQQFIRDSMDRYENHLHEMLPLIRDSDPHVADSVEQVPVLQPPEDQVDHSAPEAVDHAGIVRAFHHNGAVLFKSSQLTAVSAIGIRTAQFPRTACTPWCSCLCHRGGSFKTPEILQSILGTLFVGYSGFPMFTKPCDQHSCHLRARPTSTITYYFPPWFIARTISLVLSSTPLAGPVATLKMQRTVSGDADVLNFAKLGEVEKMRNLFEQGLASPHDVHFESGVTPLHLAISHRHINVCRFLLQMNADPFLEDRSRWAAADNAWDKILTKIFPSDTERQLKDMFSETECIERRDFTVLHKIILGLLDKDLDRELAGSTANINSADSDGRTALALAAERGDITSVTLLLRYGADPAPASLCGNTAIHCAVCAIDPCCILPLIEHGAKVDAVTNWNQTPLIYVAAYRKDSRHAQILVDARANVDVQDLDGITALGWTTITDNLPVARVLLNCGASPLLRDGKGETSLTKCVVMNRHDILDATLSKVQEIGFDGDEGDRVLLSASQSADQRSLALLQRLRFFPGMRNIANDQISAAEQMLKGRDDFSEELLRQFRSLTRNEGIGVTDEHDEHDAFYDAEQ